MYAHIYYSHFEKIVALGAERHLNTCFKHCESPVLARAMRVVPTLCPRPLTVIYFVKQFALIDAKELAPLDELIAGLMGGSDGPGAAAGGGGGGGASVPPGPATAGPARGAGGPAGSGGSGALYI